MKKSVSFIGVVACLLLAFSTFSVYSADNSSTEDSESERCKKKFSVKPKKVRRLSAEKIGLLSKETLHSLRPKHLFVTSQVQGEGKLGDLRLTRDQFQALELRSLQVETLEAIARSENALVFLSDSQAESLDLNVFSPGTLRVFMSSFLIAAGASFPTALVLRFRELDFSKWSQEDLKPFIQDPSLTMLMNKSQIDSIKNRKFLNHKELAEQKKASDLERKGKSMAATVDHGVFDQAIAEDSFDRELIPFLRISELNDQSVGKVLNMIYEIAEQSGRGKPETAATVFNHLSKESVRVLAKRSPRGLEAGADWLTIIPHLRDHSALNEAVNSLFGSAETDEELFHNMNGDVLAKLRFAELNDQVIEKIRRAAFLHPWSLPTSKISKENIAELIKRDGGLDAVATLYKSSATSKETSVFTALFAHDRLTEDILAYALSKRPGLLNGSHSKLIGKVPKGTLRDIVFEDKSSELSEDTFKAALKASLRIMEELYGQENHVYNLNIDHIEGLIGNPYIMSREEFEKIKDDDEKDHTVGKIYERIEGREVPEGFKDGHFDLLKESLKSILGVKEKVGLVVYIEEGTAFWPPLRF